MLSHRGGVAYVKTDMDLHAVERAVDRPATHRNQHFAIHHELGRMTTPRGHRHVETTRAETELE